MCVAGLRKKDFYNINVFLFQGVISSEPLFFTVIVSFCNGLWSVFNTVFQELAVLPSSGVLLSSLWQFLFLCFV